MAYISNTQFSAADVRGPLSRDRYVIIVITKLIKYDNALADPGFFLEGGDFGNPSERSERTLRGSGLTGE